MSNIWPFTFRPARRYFALTFLMSLYRSSIVIFSRLVIGSYGTIIIWWNHIAYV